MLAHDVRKILMSSRGPLLHFGQQNVEVVTKPGLASIVTFEVT